MSSSSRPGIITSWLPLAAAILFVGINAAVLTITLPSRSQSVWVGILIWGIGSILGQYLLIRSPKPLDPYLYPIIALLLGWGILLVARLAPNFAIRHVVWSMLGLTLVVGVALFPRDLGLLQRYPYTFMFCGLLLLAATLLFGSAPSGFGPRLWLKVPFVPIFFQPSELLKLIFIIFMAGYFARQDRFAAVSELEPQSLFRRSQIIFLGPLLLVWSFCMILLVWQQDLGAATLFFFGFLALLYISTGETIYLIGGGSLLLLAGTAAYYLYDRVNLRINAWLNPWPDATDRAFQIVQSLYAIGAGGILGTGFGQGYPTYIPVVHSDFTLAAIAEEWGLIGTLFVIVIFIVLVWRSLKVAALAEHPFSKYLATGVAVFLAIQSILIIGGVGKLLPLTGVTLPFVSYGGSSMVVSSIMVGLVIWLSQECYESDSPHAAD